MALGVRQDPQELHPDGFAVGVQVHHVGVGHLQGGTLPGLVGEPDVQGVRLRVVRGLPDSGGLLLVIGQGYLLSSSVSTTVTIRREVADTTTRIHRPSSTWAM